eukprot:scaffold267355_cov32-Tisochrysis_lutea.AAC.1
MEGSLGVLAGPGLWVVARAEALVHLGGGVACARPSIVRHGLMVRRAADGQWTGEEGSGAHSITLF